MIKHENSNFTDHSGLTIQNIVPGNNKCFCSAIGARPRQTWKAVGSSPTGSKDDFFFGHVSDNFEQNFSPSVDYKS